MAVSRADTSVLGRWWWTVDRQTLGAVGLLIGFGYILILASSPSVAERIGDARDALVLKQVFFLAIGGVVMIGISLLSPREIRRVALFGGILAMLLTAATLVIGVEILGARRWIALPGFAVQPSEFLKPCFAVVTAWLLAEHRRAPRFPGAWIAGGIFLLIVLLLKEQPDVGMTAVIAAVFFVQLFVDGLNLFLAGVGVLMMVGGAIGSYLLFAHVRARVEEFLHPHGPHTYQVTMALEAFGNGGLWGRGPGEGRSRTSCPTRMPISSSRSPARNSAWWSAPLIVGVFAFIVLRGLLRLLQEPDPFTVLACAGLLTGFGLQAFVNMASSLQLIPTKGMTLPFISYGGSSVWRWRWASACCWR